VRLYSASQKHTWFPAVGRLYFAFSPPLCRVSSEQNGKKRRCSTEGSYGVFRFATILPRSGIMAGHTFFASFFPMLERKKIPPSGD
jgi:hypothetical protein